MLISQRCRPDDDRTDKLILGLVLPDESVLQDLPFLQVERWSVENTMMPGSETPQGVGVGLVQLVVELCRFVEHIMVKWRFLVQVLVHKLDLGVIFIGHLKKRLVIFEKKMSTNQ